VAVAATNDESLERKKKKKKKKSISLSPLKKLQCSNESIMVH